MEVGLLFNVAFCVWLIFFGGAEKLEGSVPGYLEFDLLAHKAAAIRIIAWLSLLATPVLFWLGVR